MKKVRGIKSIDEVYRLYSWLSLSHLKYQILFLIGIETGLRVSDILSIRAKTALESLWTIREYKTSKERVIAPSMALQMAIRAYVAANHIESDEFLIYSREANRDRPLSREQAYKVFKRASRLCGLESVGTHTMRKTFAVHHYRNHRDLEALSKILNHERLETTLVYLTDCLE